MKNISCWFNHHFKNMKNVEYLTKYSTNGEIEKIWKCKDCGKILVSQKIKIKSIKNNVDIIKEIM